MENNELPVYENPESHQDVIDFVIERVHELSIDESRSKKELGALKKLKAWLGDYPYPRQDCLVSVSIRYEFGDDDFHEKRIIEMGLSEEGFEVSHMLLTYAKESGSDHHTYCSYQVDPDGHHSRGLFESDDLERTINELISLGADVEVTDEEADHS